MNTRNILILTGLVLTLNMHAASLGPAVISAGAARLDNGSLVNLGQPLAVLAGAPGGDYAPGLLPALLAAAPPHPPFAIAPAGGWSPEGFRVTFTGQPGRDYVLWASTNLTDWARVQTNHAATSSVVLEDAAAGRYPWRFYRVESQ